jgi:uncharacterized protein YggE
METVMAGSRQAPMGWLFANAILAAAVFFAAAPAWAQQPQSRAEARVIVTGEGSVVAPPDYAELRSGVTTRAKTVKEATDANTRLMTAVMAALQESGVEPKDIQTSQLSIHPLYTTAQGNSEQKLSGFSVSNQVNVTIRQIGTVGAILDRLILAGATDVGSVEFLHADVSKTLDRAREAAVADARRKAEIYARAAGLELGRVVWIAEDSAAIPATEMKALRAVGGMAAPMPIASGADILQVRITVGFGIGL